MDYLQQTNYPCMIIRLCGLSGQYMDSIFSCIEENTPSPARDVWPSFLCKVDHNDSLHVNTSNQPLPEPYNYPSPYTTSALFSEQKQRDNLCRLLMIQDDLLLPVWGHGKKKKGQLFPHLLILSSWFLAMQYPQEKIQPLQSPCRGVLRYYRALLHCIHWTLLCRTRDLICEGRLFCANNVWNYCCTRLCTAHTWASWEIYIFIFQYGCTFIDIAV